MGKRKGLKTPTEKEKQRRRTIVNKIRKIKKELLIAGGKQVEILKTNLTKWSGKLQ